jgi:hypothetical protein
MSNLTLRQAIAAIHQSFPDSALLKRLQVLQSSEAKAFLQQWPKARQALEAVAQSDLAIGNTFSEAATQSAFVSMASRQRQSETTMNTVLSHCNKLLCRTEPLSPSKQQSGMSLPFVAAQNSVLGHGHSHESHHPSLTGPPVLACEAAQSADIATTHQGEVFPVAPVVGHQAEAHIESGMMPLHVVHADSGRSFYVLPLSPTMPANFRSGRDLIIPSAAAFCDPVTASVLEFPPFTTRNCSWGSIFEMVKQPHFLWTCWRPANLGEYHSIKELWAVWHEGTIIHGVGQIPPLQLVEEEWGGTKDRATNTGQRQTWRPHNDNNVSTAL